MSASESMEERARRVGHNEAIFRELNERIQRVGAITHAEAPEIVCECGDIDCVERFTITTAEYEALRAEPDRFAVRPGHVADDVERCVDDRGEYIVVAKRPGTPAAVAQQTDPRS